MIMMKEAVFFMSSNGKENSNALYQTPFSKAYWFQAASELKDTRMLVFAALMIALRVALKPVSIPIAMDLRINTAFVVNAFGAMVFGPVVAIPAAAISDTLGCILFPTGVYYPPFVLTEIAGSVIFALFLYRTRITTTRLFLSKFCINFFVNILLQTPLMRGDYAYTGSTKVYELFDWLRITKNLVMLPIEAVVLVLLFRALVPPMKQFGQIKSTVDKLELTKRHIALLSVLFVVGSCASAVYAVHVYNTKSFSADYSAEERLVRNMDMNAWVALESPEEDEENLVTVIQSARSAVGNPEMTYELVIYRISWDQFHEKAGTVLKDQSLYSLRTIYGYSKSKAAADPVLIRAATATAVVNKHTGERLSLTIHWLDTKEETAP